MVLVVQTKTMQILEIGIFMFSNNHNATNSNNLMIYKNVFIGILFPYNHESNDFCLYNQIEFKYCGLSVHLNSGNEIKSCKQK